MLATVTKAGIYAATQAGETGHKIDIRSFKLASGSGSYTPSESQTSLVGELQLTGPIASYRVVSEDTRECTIIVPSEAVGITSGGDFSFQEIGIYTGTGELFGISVLEEAFQFITGETRLKIRVQIKLSPDLINSLNFELVDEVSCDEWAADWRLCSVVDTQKISISGDHRAIFHPGRKIRFPGNSGSVVGVVHSSTFTAGSTVIDTGTDLVSAQSTEVDYGILSAHGQSALPAQGIQLYSQRISEDALIPRGTNGLSVGPVTILAGNTVDISVGSDWLILSV